MQAIYTGWCRGCDRRIEVGEDIRRTEEGYAHAGCPEFLTTKVEQVCLVCWLVHPKGACDRD